MRDDERLQEHGDDSDNRTDNVHPDAVALNLLCGLAAGAIGTAAMTAGQHAEMRVTGRPSSVSPAEALCRLIGIETRTDRQEARLARQAHWAYGTAWGGGRALMENAGGGRPAEPWQTLLFTGLTWSAGVLLLRSTGNAPPLRQWTGRSLMIDFGHHLVFATVTGTAFRLLRRVLR
ncbi:hypothetical protein [Caenispirillum salinarum]|uniref:hypothetical protein n=1 Tax=Caenispirillum salinarum TaxID=859058 RepID=UPI00384B4835